MSSVSVLSVCGEGKEDHRCSNNYDEYRHSPQDLAVRCHDYLGIKGFHSRLSKLLSRNLSRTCGDFEQIPRKGQPPYL